MSTDSRHYHQLATETRDKAAKAADEVLRAGYLTLAETYDFMARHMERVEAIDNAGRASKDGDGVTTS
jgi:hypothetical protein